MQAEQNVQRENKDITSIIGDIIEELHRKVGIREVPYWSEVPPGASLEALKEDYEEAASKLKKKYPSSTVDGALGKIYEALTREAFGG